MRSLTGHQSTIEKRAAARAAEGKPLAGWLLGVAVAIAATASAATVRAATFGLDEVIQKAERLSREPFEDPAGRVPDWLLKITYDQWRDIRFRPELSLWAERNLPFMVQFFHAGLFYDRAVAISVVDADGVHPIEFSPSQFDYGKNDFASRVPHDLGYAGFRIHYPIKTPKYRDEVIVFLGATYFRAVGKRLGFGASARGVAINTALSSGEEFPYFKEFWLIRPAAGATDMVVLALLDSPSLTGAYRFVIHPGEQTVVHVDSQIFPRRRVEKFGTAALTSMFYFGENTERTFDNFRPEVHDSDGLLLASATGEWIWRPVDNPDSLRTSAFQMVDPRGFGLVQRDRNFDHYQDLETRPDLRPSVWVTPRGNWGPGRVELVEIPTRSDSNDNIVAFWVPEQQPQPGEAVSFSYTMYWYEDDPRLPPGGRTASTRRDTGNIEDARRFVVDFVGKELKALPADTVLRGIVTVGSGGDDDSRVLDQHVVKNDVTGGWRLVFQVNPRDGDPLELRAFLQLKDKTLTETWAYVMQR
jgi:glucans biosynthesis protein